MRFALAFVLLFSTSLLAQDAAPPVPVQTGAPKEAPLNPALPTVFIVGDSTARNGADLGWGDHFAAFFDTTRINVANRARAGRSSRTFYNEGLWEKLLAEMKAGDYVLIQMGHNDGGPPRGSLKGTGEETQQIAIDKPYTSGPLAGQTSETQHTFGWYLRKYVADTKAKGATPILLTPTTRNIWSNGQVEKDMGYAVAINQVAAQEHVPVADMAVLEAAYLQSLGPAKTAVLFPIDHTHTSAQGATLNAAHVAESLRRIKSPLAGYMLAKPNL